MSLSEFELIEQFFAPLSKVSDSPTVSLGIGDDGAVINCDSDYQYVVVTDTLIEGVHFPMETAPQDMAWKSLAVNLSDLASMGADAVCYSLALTLPPEKNNPDWLKPFTNGFAELANLFNVSLIGGDTTKHDTLVITVTAHGRVPKSKAVLRSGAKPGDFVYVTGTIGLAGWALKQWFDKAPATERAMQALNRPIPRLEMSGILREYASSAIDVSDGLLADLSHILSKSGVSVELDYTQMPFTKEVGDYLRASNDWLFPMTCGDDYEICCTVRPENAERFEVEAKLKGCTVTRVGVISYKNSGDIHFVNVPEGFALSKETLGYNHYRS